MRFSLILSCTDEIPLLSVEEEKVVPSGEGLDIQEYETRSEVGSVGSQSPSPSKSRLSGLSLGII